MSTMSNIILVAIMMIVFVFFGISHENIINMIFIFIISFFCIGKLLFMSIPLIDIIPKIYIRYF